MSLLKLPALLKSKPEHDQIAPEFTQVTREEIEAKEPMECHEVTAGEHTELGFWAFVTSRPHERTHTLGV